MEFWGDHFWPAAYPGIVVGAIYGLAVGGWRDALIGALGGLAAAALGLLAFGKVLSAEGLMPLAALLAISLFGAFLLVQAARAAGLSSSRPRKAGGGPP